MSLTSVVFVAEKKEVRSLLGQMNGAVAMQGTKAQPNQT